MPPPQLPRVEELEYWSTGEKLSRGKYDGGMQDSVTISAELYDKVHLTGLRGANDSCYASQRLLDQSWRRHPQMLDHLDYLGNRTA
jgi:hypothetical protein